MCFVLLPSCPLREFRLCLWKGRKGINFMEEYTFLSLVKVQRMGYIVDGWTVVGPGTLCLFFFFFWTCWVLFGLQKNCSLVDMEVLLKGATGCFQGLPLCFWYDAYEKSAKELFWGEGSSGLLVKIFVFILTNLYSWSSVSLIYIHI